MNRTTLQTGLVLLFCIAVPAACKTAANCPQMNCDDLTVYGMGVQVFYKDNSDFARSACQARAELVAPHAPPRVLEDVISRLRNMTAEIGGNALMVTKIESGSHIAGTAMVCTEQPAAAPALEKPPGTKDPNTKEAPPSEKSSAARTVPAPLPDTGRSQRSGLEWAGCADGALPCQGTANAETYASAERACASMAFNTTPYRLPTKEETAHYSQVVSQLAEGKTIWTTDTYHGVTMARWVVDTSRGTSYQLGVQYKAHVLCVRNR